MISLDELHLRDSGICWLCKKFCSREDATRDHVIPRSKGGPNSYQNLRLAHRSCNEKRANDILISKDERIDILFNCQSGRCHICNTSSGKKNMILDGSSGRILKLRCISKCSPAEKVRIPRQRKNTQIQGPSIRNDLIVKQDEKCYECEHPIHRKNSHKYKFDATGEHSMTNTYLVCTKCSFQKRMQHN